MIINVLAKKFCNNGKGFKSLNKWLKQNKVSILKAFSNKLKSKGKHNMVIIAAIMRKLLHLCFTIIKSNSSFIYNLTLQIYDFFLTFNTVLKLIDSCKSGNL